MAVRSVASAAASTTLAASATRRMAIITNTDANRLYLLLDSATATSSLYTVYLDTGDTYEVPANYTGEIRGIWAADGSGAALVTEY